MLFRSARPPPPAPADMESPAGVGFSYCDTAAGCRHRDTTTAQDNLAALISWFAAFPALAGRKFCEFGRALSSAPSRRTGLSSRRRPPAPAAAVPAFPTLPLAPSLARSLTPRSPARPPARRRASLRAPPQGSPASRTPASTSPRWPTPSSRTTRRTPTRPSTSRASSSATAASAAARARAATTG